MAAQVDYLSKRLLNLLVDITCDGVHMSTLYGCVSDGVICSNNGVCVNSKCQCSEEFTGEFCQNARVSAQSSSSSSLAIILGMTFPFTLYSL